MNADHGPATSSPFSEHLTITTLECTPERIVCEMPVTAELINRNGVLHGGALMALSDHTAGTLAFYNCPPGLTNVTIDAKTNFFRSARLGDTVTAIGEPHHVGRSFIVAQVVISRRDGKKLSVSTQTQHLLTWDHE